MNYQNIFNDKLIIAATGPSIAKVSKESINDARAYGCDIMAVNGAVDYLLHSDMFFTLDPSSKNLDRIHRQQNDVDCYIALPDDYELPDELISGVNILTRKDDYNEEYRITKKSIRKSSPVDVARHFGCLFGLSESWPIINNGNSCYGALGLAYLMGYKKILILGLDGTQEHKVNGEGVPKFTLSHLPLLFSSAVHQLERDEVEVVVGNINSKVVCFKQMTPTAGVQWIKDA